MFAAVLIGFGLLNAARPYKMARFEEQMDSIGSKRSMAAVEPAEWKVALTRIVGVGMVLVGVVVLFAG